MRYLMAAVVIPLVLGLVGCGADPAAYDAEWGADAVVSGGKADGLLDEATRLTFGQAVEGMILKGMMAVYSLDLTENDRIVVKAEAKSGNLQPHLLLFLGSSTTVHSETWNLSNNKKVLTKWYKAPSTGKYLLAVRAYQDKGEGRFALTATCEAGPCNGESNEGELDFSQINECFWQARPCAFKAMGDSGVALTEVKARQMLQACLDDAAVEGTSCASVCSVDLPNNDFSPADLCKTFEGMLVFFSGKSAACRAQMDTCLDRCYEMSSNDDGLYEDFWYSPEALCFETGFNGNCDSYARGHQECGGEYAEGSHEQCMALCESTDGAWSDDLDMICDEECE